MSMASLRFALPSARIALTRRRPAFSLLELLVVIAIVALLIAVLLPALASARAEARLSVCGTRLRELGAALHLYGADYDGRLMPAAYWSFEQIGEGPVVYWWGADTATGVDYERGFLFKYLLAAPSTSGLLECPDQAWDTYDPQGIAGVPTSTYGYNGYYLSPPQTPGWAFSIGDRPWLDLGHVRDTARVFAFADTAIDVGGARPRNTFLLDPPNLYQGNGTWATHDYPTTSFRHRNRTQAVHVDGHVSTYAAEPAWLTSPQFGIGTVTPDNGPHYVPDWREWK